MMHRTLPRKESEMILQKRRAELNVERNGTIVFTGASRLLNWHKHPNAIIRPSQGDIDEAGRDIDAQFPGVESYPYTIAHRIEEREIPRLSQDPKVAVLPKTTYGGEFSYAFRSYNLIYDQKRYLGMRQLNILLE